MKVLLTSSVDLLPFLVACLATAVLVALVARSFLRPKARTFLLVGPQDGGKTSLFLALTSEARSLELGSTSDDEDEEGAMEEDHGSAPATGFRTRTSLEINEGFVYIKKGDRELVTKPHAFGTAQSVRLIDVPGHPKVLGNVLNKRLDEADGVVLLIDSTAGRSSAHDRAARVMARLLKFPGKRVALVSTKQDRSYARPPQKVQRMVEKATERVLASMMEEDEFDLGDIGLWDGEKVRFEDAFRCFQSVGVSTVSQKGIAKLLSWMIG